MKFLVDAQLPRALAHFLRERGHDVVHTLDLADRNQTKDSQIRALSLAKLYIIIPKSLIGQQNRIKWNYLIFCISESLVKNYFLSKKI